MFFDSLEHNFDSWATKRIGFPDLCNSKPRTKFKRNPQRNVACRLNTRKSLRTMTAFQGYNNNCVYILQKSEVYIGFDLTNDTTIAEVSFKNFGI